MRQLLRGGKADSKNPSDFNPQSLRKGMKVEREHSSDPRVQREVAMDHLEEDPRYYEKLEKMEKQAMWDAFIDEFEKLAFYYLDGGKGDLLPPTAGSRGYNEAGKVVQTSPPLPARPAPAGFRRDLLGDNSQPQAAAPSRVSSGTVSGRPPTTTSATPVPNMKPENTPTKKYFLGDEAPATAVSRTNTAPATQAGKTVMAPTQVSRTGLTGAPMAGKGMAAGVAKPGMFGKAMGAVSKMIPKIPKFASVSSPRMLKRSSMIKYTRPKMKLAHPLSLAVSAAIAEAYSRR
jgi:Protein of unknown function (DUF5661)